MGGNIQVSGIGADKFDIRLHNREKFTILFEGMIQHMNHLFYQEHEEAIWDLQYDFTEFLSGSSVHLWNRNITDLLEHKSVFGDIDVCVSNIKKDRFIHFLNNLRNNREFSRYFTFIGHNKEERPIIDQINCLFMYSPGEHEPIFIQVDFEFVDFIDGTPSEFTKFARSSDWDDLTLGIKGVFHKYLIACICQTDEKLPGYIVTPKSTPENYKLSKTRKIPVCYCFSVSKGIRLKFSQQDWKIEGKPVWKEILPNERNYFNNLQDIHEVLFGYWIGLTDDEDFLWSFTGLLQLCKHYFDENRIKRLFIAFVDILFSDISQKLSRHSWRQDKVVKLAALEYFVDQFEYLKEYEEMAQLVIDRYYKNY